MKNSINLHLAGVFLIIAHNYFNINLVYWRDKVCRNLLRKEYFIAMRNQKKNISLLLSIPKEKYS